MHDEWPTIGIITTAGGDNQGLSREIKLNYTFWWILFKILDIGGFSVGEARIRQQCNYRGVFRHVYDHPDAVRLVIYVESSGIMMIYDTTCSHTAAEPQTTSWRYSQQ